MKLRAAIEPLPESSLLRPRERGAALLAACLALFSCDAPAPPPKPAPVLAALDSSAVARVADVSIGADQIARIALAQHLPPGEAREQAIHDALLATEARARGLDADPRVDLATSGILARVLVQDIEARAEAQGPVTDAELDEITARRWMELDRPDAARTVHAVVTLKKDATPDARARAAALAESIRKSIAPAAEIAQRTEPPKQQGGPEDEAVAAFRTAAKAVPKGDLEVRIEPLSPVVADGRTLTPGMQLERPFAQAALALAHRGDTSPVIETSYGFHVILLLERVPGFTMPREERRQKLRDEAITLRAVREKESLLARLRPSASISKNTDAILALVPVER